MLQNIKKINLDQILTLLIVVSFVYTSFYNLLFFELMNSPDYEYYFSYIETFFKINEQSNLEQGLIYHFLIALVLMFWTSEPASGSVIPMQPMSLPLIVPGKYFAFKMLLPYLNM